MVQYKDFSCARHGGKESLRTLARFSFTLIASYPLWLSETLTTVTKEEGVDIDSGVGFTVNNPGNAPTRVKVTVTPAGSGMTDNCQVENTTKGELLKYRGTVASGQDLVVDNIVDQDDQIVENNAVEDWANFEGDFITLDPGDNTIEYTGLAGATLKLEFRAAYY